MMHVIIKTTVNDIWNFVVIVLEVYDLHLEYLFLVSGLTQK